MEESLYPPMYQPCKYRLYPFPNQERELLRQFGELRFLWNHALEQRQDAWRKEKKSHSYASQCRDLARWRAYDTEGIGRVYGHVAQETLARLDDAFKHFFRRVKVGDKPGPPALPPRDHIPHLPGCQRLSRARPREKRNAASASRHARRPPREGFDENRPRAMSRPVPWSWRATDGSPFSPSRLPTLRRLLRFPPPPRWESISVSPTSPPCPRERRSSRRSSSAPPSSASSARNGSSPGERRVRTAREGQSPSRAVPRQGAGPASRLRTQGHDGVGSGITTSSPSRTWTCATTCRDGFPSPPPTRAGGSSASFPSTRRPDGRAGMSRSRRGGRHRPAPGAVASTTLRSRSRTARTSVRAVSVSTET